VPSAKRQRIRENQQRVRAQQEALKKKKAIKRRSIQIGAFVILALVIIYFQVRGSSSAKTTKTNVSVADESGTVCPAINGSSPRITHFKKAPVMCINTALNYNATVKTTAGTFVMSLDAKQYPVTTNNFVFLARYHFYDGLKFFRVIPTFVIQGGDPLNNGTGGPGYSFGGEYPKAGQYKLGTAAMANTGQPNSNGSQFFIVSGSQGEQLPPSYSIFGQVTKGINVVEKISNAGTPQGTPVKEYKIISVTISQS
jgi:peptidyl-prolyl cis-trans isomerase B (cyclophilin B)